MDNVPRFDFQCPSCRAVLRIPESCRGATGTCTHCGGKIHVPRAESVAAETPSVKTAASKRSWRIFWGVMAAVTILQAVMGAIAFIWGDDGTPPSLAAFAACFFLGTAFGAAIAGPWFFPDNVPEWFKETMPGWRGKTLLAVLSVIFYGLAWLTYSP